MTNRNNNSPPKARAIIAYVLPSVFLLLAFIAMSLPWKIAEMATIKPNLPLIVLFFWTYMKPDSIPQIVIFLCALLFDIIMPVPLGYHCLLYFIIAGIMLWRSTQFAGSTLTLFYGELIIATSIFYVITIILNQFTSASPNIGVNVVFSWAMTLLSFWLIFPALNWCNKFYRASV